MSILENINPMNMPWEEYFGGTLYWFGIVFWTLLGVALIFGFWYWLTFNIPTHIYEVVGKEQAMRFLRRTRARVKTKDEVSKLQVFGIREKFSPPQSEYYQLGKKGKLLNMLRDGTDYKPFQMSVNPGYVTIQDHDPRFWISQSVGTVIKKYTEPSFFQKYGHYMAFVFGLLVLGWMYYIQLKMIQGNLDQTIGTVERIATILKGKAP